LLVDGETFMTVTMVEIAKRTHLSPATVSRVLNGKGLGFISTATRAKVLDAARELGYQSSRAPRGLVTRTHVVALWIRNPDRPYYARILRNLLEAAHSSGYEMIVTPVHDQLPGTDGSVGGAYIRENTLSTWPIDGVLAADCPHVAEPFIKRFDPGRCPL